MNTRLLLNIFNFLQLTKYKTDNATKVNLNINQASILTF
jgi:hypothetical protein